MVASMNPSTNVGRYQLSTRFTANARLAYVSYPDKESLNSIYSALLAPVFAQQCKVTLPLPLPLPVALPLPLTLTLTLTQP